MSRIGKIPVVLPPKVKVEVKDGTVFVEGPKGKLKLDLPPRTSLTVENGQALLHRDGEDPKAKALHGLSRALVWNMVKGVSDGFVRKLEIQGVGYRAQMQGKTLKLQLGFSHDVDFPVPEGVQIECPSQVQIVVSGADKQHVGQVASNIRSYRRPEPYKGKGVRYKGEFVLRKEGKKK